MGNRIAAGMVPFAFITKLTELSWRDTLFGYGRGWLGWKDVIELAVAALRSSQGTPVDELIDFASVDKATAGKVGSLLQRMANGEPEAPQSLIEDKWLFIRLSWLYENLDSVEDPLGGVEDICGDCRYPPDTHSFLRLMPPETGTSPKITFGAIISVGSSRIGDSTLRRNAGRMGTQEGNSAGLAHL
jgi:hypothetical protein